MRRRRSHTEKIYTDKTPGAKAPQPPCLPKVSAGPEEKATAVLEHIAEGCGVRQTERLVGVHRDTVTRYTHKAGEHAKAAHDELVALSPPDDRGPVR